jgi:hypothetical protein
MAGLGDLPWLEGRSGASQLEFEECYHNLGIAFALSYLLYTMTESIKERKGKESEDSINQAL